MTNDSHVDDALFAFMSVAVDPDATRHEFDTLRTEDLREYLMLRTAMEAALQVHQSRRVQELLEANNRYLQRARDAEAALKNEVAG